ncbi:MAG: hypothetical protein TEF_02465 [Rhizobiales bacterium NRL2]|jgi:branched-chain amino acid transport system substrate-binding protein|nr:MAG: hypothetical protein TEF_02465 [Rhizobiales bacterium NRL2]
MLTRRSALSVMIGIGAAAWLSTAAVGQEGEPIKVGEINSYSALPAFTEPYRKGWQLAVEQINESGGVLGRPLEVISRDDGGKPGNAVTIAEELLSREKVDLLAGTFFSHIGLAVSDFALQKQVVFLASEPLTDALVWEKGNRYTFRLRPSTYMQSAMLAREAAASKAKRWAFVAPNYKYGQDAVAAFKKLLKEQNPEVEFVGEQWPALRKIDAGATVRALEAAKPDGIFNVLFGADLAEFVREGNLRGLFKDRTVVGLLTGEPEYLLPLGEEAPRGWIVTGYPWYDIQDPAHKKFVADYQARWDEDPMTGSLVGFNTILSIKAAIEAAGSTKTELLVQAFRGLSVETPIGTIIYRKVDHQSTMGAWVGITRWREGGGYMTGWRYVPGQDVLPSTEVADEMRPDDSVDSVK